MKFAENKKMPRGWNSMFCPIFEKKLAANIESCRTTKLIRSSNVLFKVLSETKLFVLTSHDFLVRAIFGPLRLFCPHALAYISSVGRSIYDYYDQFLMASTFHLFYS